LRPARWEARQRRSPAMSSKRSAPPPGEPMRRTMSGSISPCSRMDSVSSASSCSSKYCRGWPACGTIFSTGQMNAARSGPVPGGSGGAGRSASSPRPRARRGGRAWGSVSGAALLAGDAAGVEDLARQAEVALRPLGLRVVEQAGLPVGGRLAELDVARDDGVEDVEVGLHLVGDLVGEGVAAVEHGQHDALDAELGVEGALHAVDGGHQVGEPLERVVLALEGYDDAGGGGQGVERQEAERGGAIEHDVVVVADVRMKRVAEPGGSVGGVDQLELDGDEVLGGGDDVEEGHGGTADDGGEGHFADEDVVEGTLHRLPADAHAAGGVALGIDVHQEGALLGRGEAGGEVDRRGRLANPAFLVGDREDDGRACHSAGFGTRERSSVAAAYTSPRLPSRLVTGASRLPPARHKALDRDEPFLAVPALPPTLRTCRLM